MGRGDGVGVAPLLKRVLDVAWVGMIGLGVAGVVVAPLAALGIGQTRIGLPLHFTLEQSTYAITSTALDLSGAQIQDAAGMLYFETSTAATLAGLALLMALWGGVTVVLHQLRGLVGSLAAGSPFVPANAARIRFIGLAVLGMEAVRALTALGSSVWLDRQLVTEGLAIRWVFPLRVELILTGFAVLAIAGVFRRGTRLQEDQDLTV